MEHTEEHGKPRMKMNMLKIVVLLVLAASGASAQIQSQHQRITQAETPGQRIELKALKGATLFTGATFKSDQRVPLVVHFHGAPWLVEQHIAKHLPHAALITVQLGEGSRVYGE